MCIEKERSDTVAYGYVCQTAAVGECLTTHRFDTVRDNDACQTAAFPKYAIRKKSD